MGEVTALRHVPFEDLGLLAPLLAQRGHRVAYVDVPTADLEGLDPLAPDLLVLLGGPISATETVEYPFLAGERRLAAARLQAGRPTLGICLGAQLMALALGAEVAPGPAKEIGFAPLTLTAAGRESPLRHLAPAQTPVLHWHGDRFTLPAGATSLASTALCPHQAFAWGPAALALQFHAEATAAGLEAWYVGHALEIASTPGVTVPGLRADAARHGPRLEAQGRACLAEWLQAVGL